MTYRYFYTPCYHGPHPEDAEDTVKQPGQDTGSGTEYGTLPPGCMVLKYDDPETRCVVRANHNTPPLAGWVEKTSAEVLADYPGLWGVI